MKTIFSENQQALLQQLNAGRNVIHEIARSSSSSNPLDRQHLGWLGSCVRARLPPRHLKQLPQMNDNPAQTKAVDVLMDVIEDGGIGVIIGPSGVGKTQVAVALAVRQIFRLNANSLRAAIDHPRYFSAAEMFRELRSSFATDSRQSEIAAMARLIRPPLLVIDEVQEIKSSDYELRRLTEIIDTRYRNLVPTIIISNLGRLELSKQLGPSVVSRIFECGELIDFSNCPSYRGESVATHVV